MGRTEGEAARALHPACRATPSPAAPAPQVFYNNLLSLPFIALIMAGTGELRGWLTEPDLRNPTFMAVAAVSGVIGFAIRWGVPPGVPLCPLVFAADAGVVRLPAAGAPRPPVRWGLLVTRRAAAPCRRSFTSLWFLSTTTPSIYSLVGSLNKASKGGAGRPPPDAKRL